MINSPEPLDYEIVELDHGHVEIWTPDENGAVIGCGTSEQEAVKNAIATLSLTISKMVQQT